MRIEVLDDTKDDLVEGFLFYEEQSPGLGSYFLDSLSADIDSLLLYAGMHRIVYGSHHCVASSVPAALIPVTPTSRPSSGAGSATL